MSQDQKQMRCLIEHVLTSSDNCSGRFEPSYINKQLLLMANNPADVTVNAACCSWNHVLQRIVDGDKDTQICMKKKIRRKSSSVSF